MLQTLLLETSFLQNGRCDIPFPTLKCISKLFAKVVVDAVCLLIQSWIRNGSWKQPTQLQVCFLFSSISSSTSPETHLWRNTFAPCSERVPLKPNRQTLVSWYPTLFTSDVTQCERPWVRTSVCFGCGRLTARRSVNKRSAVSSSTLLSAQSQSENLTPRWYY